MVQRPGRRAKDKSHLDSVGWVYFVRCPSEGLIKIGYAAIPRRRLQQVRAMNAAGVEPMGLIRGSKVVERKLHLRFRDHHSHGEWFRICPELLDLIREQAEPWPDPGVAFRRHLVAPPPKRTLSEWAESTTISERGVSRTVAEWCRLTGISPVAFRSALARGHSPGGPWLFKLMALKPSKTRIK